MQQKTKEQQSGEELLRSAGSVATGRREPRTHRASEVRRACGGGCAAAAAAAAAPSPIYTSGARAVVVAPEKLVKIQWLKRAEQTE